MMFVRTTPGVASFPALLTFRCPRCDHFETREGGGGRGRRADKGWQHNLAYPLRHTVGEWLNVELRARDYRVGRVSDSAHGNVNLPGPWPPLA